MLIKAIIRTFILLLFLSYGHTTTAKNNASKPDGSVSFNCIKKPQNSKITLCGYTAGPKIILLKKRNKSRGIHTFVPKISNPTIAFVFFYSDYYLVVSQSNFTSYLLSQTRKRGPPIA